MLIYSLLDDNISHENIPGSIEKCFRMAGKTASHLPDPKTIHKMNQERLLLAQTQLQVVCLTGS